MKSPVLAKVIALAMLSGLGTVSAEPVPDFSITDINTTSPRFGMPVSPRDYLHQVSGYYLGDPN